MNNSKISKSQKSNLIELAKTIAARDTPLGVGLHNQCWAGLAIEIAKSHGETTKTYYGLSIHQMKPKINLNNSLPPQLRNKVMIDETLRLAQVH